MLQKIINIYDKLTNKNKKIILPKKLGGYSDFENGELFNQVLDKCINENTDITGLAGTGKSSFINILTAKLHKERKSYLLCANAINELAPHFKKHLVNDKILIFCLKEDNSHTIDINYLFSLEVFLDFICVSDSAKQKMKKSNYITWFKFFDDENNSALLKDKYFAQLKDLIKSGHIDNYGDLDNDSSQKNIYAYLTLQKLPIYYNLSDEDKSKYIFFLNILQLSLSPKATINILFDEEKVFFDGYKNSYIKALHINGINNNFIFSSQLVDDIFEDTQVVCFKGYVHKDYRSKYIGSNINKFTLNIKELKPGYFYLFDKEMKSFTNYPIKVPYEEEKVEIQWELFLNNKQKKMSKHLQLELPINMGIKEKKLKI